MKRLALSKICIILICILFMAYSSVPYLVGARTVDEINLDIQKTQDALNKLKNDLAKANQDLVNTQGQKNSTNSELNKVKEQIAEIDQTIALNELKKNELAQQIQLKQYEKEETQKLQDNQIVDTYIDWKIDDYTNSVFVNSGDLFKNVIYYDFMTKETEKGIKALGQELNDLNNTSAEYQKQTEDLQTQVMGLNDKKIFWETQIKLYEDSLAKAKASKDQLTAYSSQLEAQQKNYNAEFEKAVAATQAGSEPLVTGQAYFTGSVSLPRQGVECSSGQTGFNPGTESVGHGIGMSQWGANGMAWQGRTATQILTFYYPGTKVETRPAKIIKVNGVDSKTMEDYVSGLGEVSDKACGTVDQINAWKSYADQQGWANDDPKRNKYLLGGDCWPEEAIKAQVIAARTYAYNRTTSICTTDACQVYKGGFGKAWAAWETKDQVVLYGNAVIDSFYSAYNNNGAGNADIDTVWTGSSPVPYLTSVNDNSITSNPRFCGQNIRRENWRTNSYSLTSFKAMLTWASDDSKWGKSGDYNFVEYASGCSKNGGYGNSCVVRSKITSKIGNLTSISLVRDASGRVKKVNFTGDKGQGSVSGIFFRMMFNSWAGSGDTLKSITFNMAVAN